MSACVSLNVPVVRRSHPGTARWAVLLISLLVYGRCAPAGTTETPFSAEAQNAIVSHNWPRLLELLPAGLSPDLPSHVRLLRAHACLATNRNNEALCLFLNTADPNQLHQWEQWSTSFATDHPDSCIALYLLGDAYARLERWEPACEAFTAALQRDPNCLLAANARAVVHTIAGQWDEAREDFRSAAQRDCRLADLYANRGFCILQRRTDAVKALEYYQEALRISPDSVLALNGRACAEMLLHRWDTAADDFDKAARMADGCLAGVNILLAANLQTLLVGRNEAADAVLAGLAGIKPGMSLNEQMQIVETMPRHEQQIALDVINNASRFNNRVQGSSILPSQVGGNLSAGVSTMGPFVSGGVNAGWDIRDTARFNQTRQDALAGNIQNSTGLAPREMGNFEAWMHQHLPGNKYGQLTRPGGVSSSEIASEPIDTGLWNVHAMCGLAYKIPNHDAVVVGQVPGGDGAEMRESETVSEEQDHE